ncbi:MAG TPA: hypothetical protein PLV45_08280 [bacterium]|nr:hypothetical protein [bacterium]
MEWNREKIRRLAELAGFAPESLEIDRIAEEMTRIIEFAHRLPIRSETCDSPEPSRCLPVEKIPVISGNQSLEFDRDFHRDRRDSLGYFRTTQVMHLESDTDDEKDLR